MQAPSLRYVGIVLAVVIAIGGAAPAHAQTPIPTPRPSTGIDNLFVVSSEPLEFDFLYGGDNQPAQILVGNPTGSVGFNVYTDWQWRDMAAGDRTIAPVGSGTPNANQPGNLFWEASSPSSGFYHVQVYQKSAGPASFWIALAGPGAASPLVPVSASPPKPAKPVEVKPVPEPAPTKAVAQPTAVTLAVQPTATPKPTPVPTARPTQPSRTGEGNWQAIAGDPIEYVFRYAGGDTSARISAGSEPAGAVAFNVYTDQQWTDLGNGRYWTVPVGRGTTNSYEAGNLFWEARSPVPEQYHVQLVRLGNQPTQYWIDLRGSGAASDLKAISPAVPAR